MAEIGAVIGGIYKLTGYIDRGGMSVVYMAENIRLKNRLAVKEISKNGDDINQLFIESMTREAEMMKSLDYVAFPRIVDICEDDEALYLVMDYVEGRTLATVLKENGPQSEERVLDWAVQLCDALLYLHHQPSPIIYRDLKPSNIILKPNGELRVIDFGTARVYKPEKTNDTIALGTRGFAPPEQYFGQTDERSDIYALGVTMRCLLTGIYPEIDANIDYHAIYSEKGFSTQTIQIIDRCTENKPEDRFQTCEELYKVLISNKNKKRPDNKRRQVIIISLAAVIILSALALFLGLYFIDHNNAAESLAQDESIAAKTVEIKVDMPDTVTSAVQVDVKIDDKVDENNSRSVIPADNKIYVIETEIQNDVKISVLINNKIYREYKVDYEKETVELENAFDYSE